MALLEIYLSDYGPSNPPYAPKTDPRQHFWQALKAHFPRQSLIIFHLFVFLNFLKSDVYA